MNTKQEEKQSQKDTQIRRKNRIVNRIGYFLLIIAALAYIAPYLSGHIVYRKSRYCTAAESDARSIAALVGDYFSIPTHTQIKTSDIDYIPSGNNTFTITATDPSIMITITVTDASGRCPVAYQDSHEGWDGNDVLTEVILSY